LCVQNLITSKFEYANLKNSTGPVVTIKFVLESRTALFALS